MLNFFVIAVFALCEQKSCRLACTFFKCLDNKQYRPRSDSNHGVHCHSIFIFGYDYSNIFDVQKLREIVVAFSWGLVSLFGSFQKRGVITDITMCN